MSSSQEPERDRPAEQAAAPAEGALRPKQIQLPLTERAGAMLKDVAHFLESLKQVHPELYEEKPRPKPNAPPPPPPVDQSVLWPEGDPARAKAAISARVEHFSRVVGVRCRRVCIKDQRTLWGSCTASGQLNFNWRLVLAPPEVLDYVVIHELCHLKEMNHSKRFWHLVNNHCPDHKLRRRWLKSNSEALRKACPSSSSSA
ncbi:MAG: M48 family metallopeptidase [Elusimicrobiota bacterium]|jgi:hypothetical protein